jgi:hypothetical protein
MNVFEKLSLLVPELKFSPTRQEMPSTPSQVLHSLTVFREILLDSTESSPEENNRGQEFRRAFNETQIVGERIRLTCDLYKEVSLHHGDLAKDARGLIDAIVNEYGPSKSERFLSTEPRSVVTFFKEEITTILIPLADKIPLRGF